MVDYDLFRCVKKVLKINLILIVSFCLFAHYYQYQKTKSINVYLDNGFFEATIAEEKLLNIKSIMIDQKKIKYQIEAVSDEIIYDNHFNQYRDVRFKTNLMETKFAKVVILSEKTTIKNELLKLIKEKSK